MVRIILSKDAVRTQLLDQIKVLWKANKNIDRALKTFYNKKWLGDPTFCAGLVSISSRFLKCVKTQDREIVLRAIETCDSVADCYKSIDDKTIFSDENVLKLNLDFLAHTENQPPELCLEWCKLDGNNLANVHIHSSALVRCAVETTPGAFRYARVQYDSLLSKEPESLCMFAVQKDWKNIQYVWTQTDELVYMSFDLSHGKSLSLLSSPKLEYYKYCVAKGWPPVKEHVKYDLFDQDVANFYFEKENKCATEIPNRLHTPEMIRWLTRNEHFDCLRPSIRVRQEAIFYFLRVINDDPHVEIDFDFMYESLFMFVSFKHFSGFLAKKKIDRHEKKLKRDPAQYIKFFTKFFETFPYLPKYWTPQLVIVAGQNSQILKTIPAYEWHFLTKKQRYDIVKAALLNDPMALDAVPAEYCSRFIVRKMIFLKPHIVSILHKKLVVDLDNATEYEAILDREVCNSIIATKDFSLFQFLPEKFLPDNVWNCIDNDEEYIIIT